MANSVDPDQIAPSRSSLIWVYTFCSDLPVRKFKNIMVHHFFLFVIKFFFIFTVKTLVCRITLQ